MLLCSGGCRSGKSAFAQTWTEARGATRVYIATAYLTTDHSAPDHSAPDREPGDEPGDKLGNEPGDDAGDAEMHARIEKHRAARGAGWVTVEAASSPLWADPEHLVTNAAAKGDALLFDCLTLWTSLCLEKGLDEQAVIALTRRLVTAFAGCGKPVALVTNEVGMGLVPGSAIGRSFRDMAGLVNQEAAKVADTVVFMVSGLPLYVKGKE